MLEETTADLRRLVTDLAADAWMYPSVERLLGYSTQQ
jgi:hypothetical protein